MNKPRVLEAESRIVNLLIVNWLTLHKRNHKRLVSPEVLESQDLRAMLSLFLLPSLPLTPRSSHFSPHLLLLLLFPPSLATLG